MLKYKRLLNVVNMIATCKIFNEINEMLDRYKESIKAFSSTSYERLENKDSPVSIIVPTRNEAKNIQRLIMSLLRLITKILRL